jgi:hypothetical protein
MEHNKKEYNPYSISLYKIKNKDLNKFLIKNKQNNKKISNNKLSKKIM